MKKRKGMFAHVQWLHHLNLYPLMASSSYIKRVLSYFSCSTLEENCGFGPVAVNSKNYCVGSLRLGTSQRHIFTVKKLKKIIYF